MASRQLSQTVWAGALGVFVTGLGLALAFAANQGYQKGRSPKLAPAAIKSSKLKIQAELAGRAPSSGNLTSPVAAGPLLLLINQAGTLDAWDGTTTHSLLTAATFPAGITSVGGEAILNVAANVSGSRVYVIFTSTTVPGGVPQRLSPRPGADAWQLLYRFDFDGAVLSNPAAITALQVRSDGHTGGGLTMTDDNTLLFATGEGGDSGEDGREYAQDPANHLGKILRIDATTGATDIVAVGLRNVQRLVIDSAGGDAHLVAADIGGWVAEEINAIALGGLLQGGSPRNFGWGRNAADGRAREGTFYVDRSGQPVGAAPVPEPGFTQPIGQFGRERAEFIAVTGPVASAQSFSRIRYLIGELVSGSVYALTGSPTTSSQSVFRVSLVDSASRVITLRDLTGGGRPDPRFFNFPDGRAGVLLEATGDFYRLTEVR
jgi:hypothetical protein